jgi:transposase
MKNRKFSEEFKKEAVRLVVEQRIPVGQACLDLGMGRSTLEKWLSSYRSEQQPEIAAKK